jgi:hypothetical protein
LLNKQTDVLNKWSSNKDEKAKIKVKNTVKKLSGLRKG